MAPAWKMPTKEDVVKFFDDTFRVCLENTTDQDSWGTVEEFWASAEPLQPSVVLLSLEPDVWAEITAPHAAAAAVRDPNNPTDPHLKVKICWDFYWR